MVTREIADYLELEGVGTVGTDIFIGDLPKDPANAISMVSAPSEEQERYYDVRYMTIDFWVRNKKTDLANSKAQEIFDTLHLGQNYDLTSYRVYYSHAISNIEDLDKDSIGRKLYKLSIRFIYRELIS